MSDKDINQMDFKELRNEVQMLRDELAITQRKYEDLFYNLDNENFSSSIIKEKDKMKAEIKITAEEVSSKVSSKDVESMISQTAKSIYSRIEGVEGDYSEISQSVGEISSKVSGENGIFSLFEQTADGFYFDGNKAKFTGVIFLTNNEKKDILSIFVSETGGDEGNPVVRMWTQGNLPLVLGNGDTDVYLGSNAEKNKVASRDWVKNNCTAKFG